MKALIVILGATNFIDNSDKMFKPVTMSTAYFT